MSFHRSRASRLTLQTVFYKCTLSRRACSDLQTLPDLQIDAFVVGVCLANSPKIASYCDGTLANLDAVPWSIAVACVVLTVTLAAALCRFDWWGACLPTWFVVQFTLFLNPLGSSNMPERLRLQGTSAGCSGFPLWLVSVISKSERNLEELTHHVRGSYYA